MKKLIFLIFLMGLFGNLQAEEYNKIDENDTDTSPAPWQILCKRHWYYNKLVHKRANYCTHQASIDVIPSNDFSEIIRSQNDPIAFPNGLTEIRNTSVNFNLGYLIDLPDEGKNYDFIPQFRFIFERPTDLVYEGHKVFQHRADPTMGIIFDVRVGRGNTDWIPVTQADQTIEGGYWHDTRKERWYYAGIRAFYVIKPEFMDKFNNSPEVNIIKGGRIGVAYFKGRPVNGSEAVIEEYDNRGEIWGTVINLPFNLKVHQRITTCDLADSTPKTQHVKLKKVLSQQINPEIEGGKFYLNVRCNVYRNYDKQNKLHFPHLFVTFSGQTQGVSNNNDGNNTLLAIQKGDGMAEGVSLKIKDSNGTEIRFGPESRVKGNPGQMPLPQRDDGDSRNEYRVFYVKNPGEEIKPGKVKARATFTFSYQ